MDGRGSLKWNIAEVVLCMKQKRIKKRKTQEDKTKETPKKQEEMAGRKQITKKHTQNKRKFTRERSKSQEKQRETLRNKEEILLLEVFFWTWTKMLPQKGPPKKSDNLSHFAERRWFEENRYVAPVLDLKLVFFNLHSFGRETMMLQETTNSNQAKSKDKDKDFEREKKTGNQKRKKGLMREEHCNWILRCCSCHERKAKKKQRERNSKTRKTTPKNKEKIRRVKGHLSWPLNPPQENPKMVSCCPRMAVWKRIVFFFKQKMLNFLKTARYLGTKKHKNDSWVCTGAETEHTTFLVVSSVFSENEEKTRNRYPRKVSPENVPFFCLAQSYHKAFPEQTQFSAKRCVLRSLSDKKKPIFTEEFWKGQDKTKKKQRRTTQVDSSQQHFGRFFRGEKLRFREGPELEKRKSDKTRRDNWASQSSDETLRKPVFREKQDSRPHYWTHCGPIIEPMNPKIGPPYRSLQHIYIYIYTYTYTYAYCPPVCLHFCGLEAKTYLS